MVKNQSSVKSKNSTKLMNFTRIASNMFPREASIKVFEKVIANKSNKLFWSCEHIDRNSRSFLAVLFSASFWVKLVSIQRRSVATQV